MNETNHGYLIEINGPVVKGSGLKNCFIGEQVLIGKERLPGEIIRLQGDIGTIQVYEETDGLQIGEPVDRLFEPLSVVLGPGLLGSIFDGLQRPLEKMATNNPFIVRGSTLPPLDTLKKWHFTPIKKINDEICPFEVIGTISETENFIHKIFAPHDANGIIKSIVSEGDYSITDEIANIETDKYNIKIKLSSKQPVRKSTASLEYYKSVTPLITGQRILDFFFPLAKGGTAIIPGGFGAGKTITQHQLARWCDADIIIYIGCGERGNEMVEVLEEFPKLIDPRNGRPLMERTVLIANTSNMPVTAREASIYTGITIAEYFRNMGYNVALMADSTSRWAEALREISGRLEELPIEEGYPSYLAHRLAEFYERSGCRKIDNERIGSITIIGAISPPGGDFSEPVTVHSQRSARAFWALDKNLASARHFPSVNWMQSYSGYMDIAASYWKNAKLSGEWDTLRQQAFDILKDDDSLQKIVKLIGPDALQPEQKITLLTATMIKEGFLQQPADDPVDSYCTMERQILLMQIIMNFNLQAINALNKKIPAEKILNMKLISDIMRAKHEIGNDETDKLVKVLDIITSSFHELETNHE